METKGESTAFHLVSEGQPYCSVVLAAKGPDSVVVNTAVEQLNACVKAATGIVLPVVTGQTGGGNELVAVSGEIPAWLKKAGFVAPKVGPQGFAVRRMDSPCGGNRLVVWGETPLGCRYGIIEVLRSLKRDTPTSLSAELADVVDAPRFPVRIYYLNFAEHLQNAFNVNPTFDVKQGKWTRHDWEALLKMLAVMRYTAFEFWLPPTFYSPEALKAPQDSFYERFAQDMHWAIDRAQELGIKVTMLQTVNTVGPDWHQYCPNVPEERRVLLSIAEHWAAKLDNLDTICLFPGDPGGCNRNGCTHETFVDLCLDIVHADKAHGKFQYEIGTWGTPIWGWGEAMETDPGWAGTYEGVRNGWAGGPDRAKVAFAYLEKRLPEFPADTLVSINMGLSPDSDGDSHGGSGRPYVDAIRKTHQVLTWDYAASEGEGAVIPRFRVAKILARRRKEAEWGYSGGINYTMSPRLNVLQAFAASEAYWNPETTEDAILKRFSAFAFGEANVAEKVFPYTDASGDWGGEGWHGTIADLRDHLRGASAALKGAPRNFPAKLPLVPSAAEYRGTLEWYVGLLSRLCEVALRVDEVRELTGAKTRSGAAAWALKAPDGPAKSRVARLLLELPPADGPRLRAEYFERVYGLYEAVQGLPDTAVNRGVKKWLGYARGSAGQLFSAFRWEFWDAG